MTLGTEQSVLDEKFDVLPKNMQLYFDDELLSPDKIRLVDEMRRREELGEKSNRNKWMIYKLYRKSVKEFCKENLVLLDVSMAYLNEALRI